MIGQCISVLAVLGVVIVAMLIMVQAVSLEAVTKAVGRGLLLIFTTVVLSCVMKALFVVALEIVRTLLLRAMTFLGITVIAIAAAVGMARIFGLIFQKGKTTSRTESEDES